MKPIETNRRKEGETGELELMQRFSARKVADLLAERGLSRGEFIRRCVKAAPDTMKPTTQYINLLLAGKMSNPGVNYLTLFASVLSCPRDDFFEPDQESEEGSDPESKGLTH